MSKNSEGVIRWRIKTKSLIIEHMGGCCQICGYNRCQNALDLHHINPKLKELTFGEIRANPVAIAKIAEELKKCILLCANCHREFHAGYICLPDDYAIFDDKFIQNSRREIDERKERANQKIKNKLKGGKRLKILLTNEEFIAKFQSEFKGNKSKFAEFLNVSEAAVRKRLKKIESIK